jgi:hypothetical protein
VTVVCGCRCGLVSGCGKPVVCSGIWIGLKRLGAEPAIINSLVISEKPSDRDGISTVYVVCVWLKEPCEDLRLTGIVLDDSVRTAQ